MRFLFLFASVLACCTSQDTNAIGEVPPLPADAGVTTSSTVETFAMSAIFLGDTDRQGIDSKNAWQLYGFNLDGLVTNVSSTNACTVRAGAPTSTQTDAPFGFDNSWGANAMPVIITAFSTPSPSATTSSDIAAGAWTVQFQITGLSGDARQTASGLEAQAFVSAARDGGQDWPVLASSLADTTIAGGARTRFSTVYVTDGTLVAKDSSEPLTVPLALCAFDCSTGVRLGFPVHIRNPMITITTRTASGMIGGVIDTEELVGYFRTVGGRISTSLCGEAFNGIADQIRGWQDILLDGTNAPNTPCTGISIGLGFTVTPIANPTRVAADPAPLPDPCDAGTD